MSELRSLEYVAFDEGRSRPAALQGSASAPCSQANQSAQGCGRPINRALLFSRRSAALDWARVERGPLNQVAGIESQKLARQAHELVRDLTRPDPRIYWLDLVATALVLYLSLWATIAIREPAMALAAGVV